MTIQPTSHHLTRLLVALIVLAPLVSVAVRPDSVQAIEPGIIPLPPDSVTFNTIHTFDGDTPGPVDGVLSNLNIHFAERFVGQSLSAASGGGGDLFDIPVGTPTNPLTPQPGAAGQNLVLVDRDGAGDIALAGIGPRGLPAGAGQGAVAVQFDEDQAAVGFDIRDAQGGPLLLAAYARDGALLGTASLPSADGPHVIGRAGGVTDMAGLLLFSIDPFGLSFDSFRFHTSEPIGLEADMELVSKEAMPDPALIGAPFSYVIILRNNGPDTATGIDFFDTIEIEGIAAIGASGPQGRCSVSRVDDDPPFVQITCPIGSLGKGGTARVQIDILPNLPGTITNDGAFVGATETDPNPANNSNSARPTVATVLTPEDYIPVVIGKVGALAGAGVLNDGQARALTASLQAARNALERGNVSAARGQIGAFRNKVDALERAGSLSPEQAQELRQEADRLLQSIAFTERFGSG
jgi:hypothetical protein